MIKLIEAYWPDITDSGNPDDKYVFRSFLDQVLVFLAQVGHKKKILEMSGFTLEDEDFKKIMDQNWPKLLEQFMTPTGIKQMPEFVEKLVSINKEYSPGKIGEIKDNKKQVNFRRWLLKRQMLGIYYAIQLLLRGGQASRFIEELAADAFDNYIQLICGSVRGYILNAVQVLDDAIKPELAPIWHDEVMENLTHQIRHVKERYSDVNDFFKETMRLCLFSHLPQRLEDFFDKNDVTFKKAHAEKLIDKLKNEVLPLCDTGKGEILKMEWKNQRCNEKKVEFLTLAEARRLITDSIGGTGNFQEYCRKRFTPERLELLAVSLDNHYATEAAYFFKTPAIKMDNDQRIDTELCLLKKWGSTGGLFERDRYINASFGGGYFLFHNGFGLGIDVGPDFLRHLTQTDFDLLDINGVVCTHPHHDHAAEFQRILLGIREYNRTAGYKRLYYLFPDADDQELMLPGKIREDFALKVFRGNRGDDEKKAVYYFPDTPWGKLHGIRVETLQVKHHIYTDSRYKSGKRKRNRSYALLVSPLVDGKPLTSILFSGDAEYQEGLFEKIDPKYKPEILVLNISSARMRDITAAEPKASFIPPSPPVKKNHLGYSGVLSCMARLREKYDYKLAVISDFFEAQSQMDSRLIITKSLSKDLPTRDGTPPTIIASEVGTRFRFTKENGLEFFCSNRCHMENKGFVPLRIQKISQVEKDNRYAKKEPIRHLCLQCELGYAQCS